MTNLNATPTAVLPPLPPWEYTLNETAAIDDAWWDNRYEPEPDDDPA